MTRPKHRRCGVCNVVTARYSHTERAGAVVLKVWHTDPGHGQVTTDHGRTIRCLRHAND